MRFNKLIVPTSLWNDEQIKPIKHLRVIDFTVMLTGPYLTRILAQYGADIVKVEQLPEGDPLRTIEKQCGQQTKIFDLLNQGKKSLGVQLRSPEGLGYIRQLVSEADIFIENFRSGILDQLGLGYAELSQENPDLLYVSLRGLSGSNETQAAHDLNIIAASGIGEWFLEKDIPNYSTFFGDTVGGVFVPLTKILMHMINPDRRGMHLVSSMDEGFRALYLSRAYDEVKSELVDEQARPTFGAHHLFSGKFPHSRYYKCREGQWVSLQAIQKKHWDNFCDAVDRAEWKNKQHDPELVTELEALFSDAPASYWESLTGNRECCLVRVIPWAEHLEYSQARPQLLNDPLSWAGFQAADLGGEAAPLGRDTFAVFHAMGFTNKEISEAFAKGILAGPNKK